MEKKRYTLCIHTGRVQSRPTVYDFRYHNILWLAQADPDYHPKYAKYRKNVNFAGTRTVSCCGVFELTDINDDSVYDLFLWGPLKTRLAKQKAFNNFLEDVKKQHGSIIVYLLERQKASLFGEFVRDTFKALDPFWNPKTRNKLYPYYKTLNSGPPLRVKSAVQIHGLVLN